MPWRAAMLVLVFTSAAWGQPASTSTCQWGNCVNSCQEICQSGYVCGVEGRCVLVAELPPSVQEEASKKEAAEATEVAQRAAQAAAASDARRRRARYLTRYFVGGGMGELSLRKRHGRAIPVSVNFGLRQQLSERTGLHLQLMGMAASNDTPVDAVANGTIVQRPLALMDVGASMSVYFGPFNRFYLGPCLFLGYRWYTTRPVQDGISPLNVGNILLREGGARLGFLLGSEEQVDITVLLTSSFDQDTPGRLLAAVGYEFR